MDVLSTHVETLLNLMAAAYIEEIYATSEYTVTKYTQAQTSNRWRKFCISSVR